MLKSAAQSKAGTVADGLDHHQSSRAESALQEARPTESRFDPIAGTWTIFAPHREQRPDEFETPPQMTPPVKVDCPFCTGAESNTPPAIWVGQLAENSDERTPPDAAYLTYQGDALAKLPIDQWTIRVVPNRFPAITGGPDPAAKKPTRATNLFPRRVNSGGHEVIIEAPRHVRSITELDLAELSLLFTAYRDRIAYWYDVDSIAYISVFKNVGGEAGASLGHSHSQLIAANVMPTQFRGAAERVAKYRATTGCCLQCDLIRAELKEDSRVVAKSDDFVAYCPFASPMPMSVRITTLEHLDRFDQLRNEQLVSLSRMVGRVVSWLEKLHPETAYNLLLNTRPPGIRSGSDSWHWCIDIFPRLTRLAGFEFSTDCKINPMLPELAAQRYRDCAAAEDPRRVLS